MINFKKYKQVAVFSLVFFLVCVAPCFFTEEPAAQSAAYAAAGFALLIGFLGFKPSVFPASKVFSFWILVLAVSSLPVLLSPLPLDGLFHWLAFPLLLSAWFFWSIWLKNDQEMLAGQLGIRLVLLVLLVFGVLQMIPLLQDFNMAHAETYQVKVGFGHRNLFAQFLVVLMPMLFAFSGDNGSKNKLNWSLLLAALTVSLLLLNRMVWVSLLLMALIAFWHATRQKLVFKPLYLLFILPVLLLLLLVDDFYTLWHHVEMTLTTDAGTTRDRLLLLQRSVEVFLSAPLIGVGFGFLKVLLLAYDQSGMLTETGRFFYAQPHNDYLWLLAEGGLLIGLPYLLLHLHALKTAWRNYWVSKSSKALALFIAWLMLMMASASNYPILSAPFIVMQGLLLAMVYPVGTFTNKLSFDGQRQKFLKSHLIPLLLCALVMAVGSLRFFSLKRLAQVEHFHSLGDFATASSELDGLEVFINTDNEFRSLKYLQALSAHPDDANERLKLLVQANKITPWHPHIQFQMALASLQMGNDSAADAYLNQAVLNTPKYQNAWLFIANQHLKSNNWRLAFKAFQEADANNSTPLYQKLGVQLAQDSIMQMIAKTSDRKMELTLQAIYNTPQWAFEIMVKSVRNQTAFNMQVYIDACYYMYKYCGTYGDCSLAEEMINKYLPNGLEDLNLDDETSEERSTQNH